MATQEAKSGEPRKRQEARRMAFSDLAVRRLRPPAEGQELIWDTGQKGLALLMGSGGTKAFRSQFKLNGRWLTRSLGRFGELSADDSENINIATAREMVRQDRILAAKGIDPRKPDPAKAKAITYKEAVERFIEEFAKRRQRHWRETERVLLRNAPDWHDREITAITKADGRDLIRAIAKAGHMFKASNTLSWLRTLWSWLFRNDLVAAPLMDAVDFEPEKRKRTRVFTDEEIAKSWHAAGKLEPTSAAYIRLMILLVPRKSALAAMRWQHLDEPERPVLWTTPPELVKQSLRATLKEDARTYETPLPEAASALLIELRKRAGKVRGDDYVFRGRLADTHLYPGSFLVRRIVRAGAPSDFGFHIWRHTASTWLKDHAKRSTFERGLILNHAESGVTAGYTHAKALAWKAEVLGDWVSHVAKVVAEHESANPALA